MNHSVFASKKQIQEKITMLTCYDYTTAKILNDSLIDALLVGDSLAMTMHGFKDTTMATLAMMELHTAAVNRGAKDKYIISDLPFLSYRKSVRDTVCAAEKLMRAGARALKIEGAAGNLKLISHLVESGIPVMGHLGLTPQLIHVLNGYKVQGKSVVAAERLKKDALLLQKAGCFSLVLECIPASLAREITQLLTIPTIGIGAGLDTDGQILVLQDLLGLNLDFKAKFVKHFLNGSYLFSESVQLYIQSVQQKDFPSHEYCY